MSGSLVAYRSRSHDPCGEVSPETRPIGPRYTEHTSSIAVMSTRNFFIQDSNTRVLFRRSYGGPPSDFSLCPAPIGRRCNNRNLWVMDRGPPLSLSTPGPEPGWGFPSSEDGKEEDTVGGNGTGEWTRTTLSPV